jgi:amino acid transporter
VGVATATVEPSGKAPVIEVRQVKRALGLGSLVFIMFFTVSGGAYGLEDVIGSSGPGIGIFLIIATPIVFSLPSALMVAELATAMPVEGGYYFWVKKALGPFWGFQEGWWSWLTSFVDMAIYPVLFVEYSAYFFSAFGTGHTLNRWLLGFGVIWVFTGLNILGSKVIGDSSKIFGVIVLLPFVLMTVIGLFKMQFNPVSPLTAGGESVTSAFSLGLFVVMWNYLGWDGLSTVAGEMKDPKRDYPKTLLISLPLITACYLLPTLVGLAVVGDSKIEWTAGAFTQIAEAIGGKWLGVFLAGAALVSAAGLFASLLLSVSRVPFVMGEDGYLPKALLKVHPKYGTPWVALVVSSAIYSIFILGPFQSLVVVDVTIYAGALALEFVALIVLRITHPNMKRPYKIPGGLFGVITVAVLPMAVIAFAVWAQIQDVGLVQAVGWAALGLATGPPLYFVARFFKRRRGEEERDVEVEFEDEPTLELRGES